MMSVAMAESQEEVVLITGFAGFLGQCIVDHLARDKSVKEIRGLDKSCSEKVEKLDDFRRIKIFKRNLIDAETCRDVVNGVDVVLHCAALVSYDFPASKETLRENNVLATENLLKLCIDEGVKRFVYCSSTEVTLQSYIKGGIVAVVIYSSESKIGTPLNEDRLIFREYAATKLNAEKLVLRANETALANGQGVLHTVSLRPTLLYGENDKKFITKILKFAKTRGNILPRLAGKGGKQQITYVGNAAWAFICAKNTLRNNPKSIAGLPITVTDDTPVLDVTRFCHKLTKDHKNCVKLSSWTIPIIISYLIAWIFEIIANFNVGFFRKLSFQISPRSMIAYMGSVILYDRTRASIHLDYTPIYSADEAMSRSSFYYCQELDI